MTTPLHSPRALLSIARSSSPCRLHMCGRVASRSANYPRQFSSSSLRCVNLTRPTSRPATAAPAAQSSTAKPVTPAKPAAPPSAKPSPSPTSSPSVSSPPPTRSLATGLDDGFEAPSTPLPDASPEASNGSPVDWSRSFHGLSSIPFSKEAGDVLMAPINPEDVEIKPDGIVYLPEIKYRRILNRAFGPGGWGLAPRGETLVTPKSVTREYGLVVHGRLVSLARGEQQYFDPEGIPTATEGCKSNALMRCCKDLGIASELWDPVFIRKFKAQHSKEVWVEHVVSKKKKKIFMRKDVDTAPGGFKLS